MLPNPTETTYKLKSGPSCKSVIPPNPSPNRISLSPGEEGFSMTLDYSSGGKIMSFLSYVSTK